MKAVTQNACQLCSPLGASLVFKGVRNCVPLLHGSQGCATYIRRYLISHFREPVDIASSSFTEETAVFGGGENLRRGMENVIRQYRPELVGVASTCLSETIGDDVPRILRDWKKEGGPVRAAEEAVSGQESGETEVWIPEAISVATPSYSGSHSTGFHRTVLALVSSLAGTTGTEGRNGGEGVMGPGMDPGDPSARRDVNLFSGMISPADIRALRSWLKIYGLSGMILPDYSETLDGPAWREYQRISPGGCGLEEIRAAHRSLLSLELSAVLAGEESAAVWLEEKYAVPAFRTPQPVGIRLSDALFSRLNELTGRQALPAELEAQRGRLADSYADAHKYLFGRRAAVFGEKDHVLALAVFLEEIGITPALCAAGEGRGLEEALKSRLEHPERVRVLAYGDFEEIEKAAAEEACDLAVGNSKGYAFSRRMEIPLVRTGFPVHDRLGAQRLESLGYSGTQSLFDRIVNTLLEEKQNRSSVGYSYI